MSYKELVPRFPVHHKTAFALIGMLAAGSTAFADKMMVLDDPVKAAQVRVDLIQQARKSVVAQYFIVGRDPLTYAGFALARDAVWRGCDVRVIIDAGSNRVPPPVLAYLMTQGVQIKVYHPFQLSHLSWITRRMHDKGLSTDGTKMVRGGRNVEDPYFGRAKRNFIDRDAFVAGGAVKESEAYFNALWDSDQVSWIDASHLSAAKYEEGRRLIDQAKADIAKSRKWRTNTGTNWGNSLPDVGPVRFLHDPVGKKNVEPGIAESLRDILRTARKSILIETPYFVPTPEFLREIRTAQARGVRSIEIITNSAMSNDGLYAQAGYESAKPTLLKLGLKLWEFKGPDTLHAKSAVIDGEYAVIGSFNLDPRSQHLNTETAVAARNRGVATALTKAINAHKSISYAIGSDGRPVGTSSRYPGLSLGNRIKLTLYRMSLPLIWAQL